MFSLYINKIYSIQHKDELKDLKEIEDLQSKEKQVRLVEKLGKQGFQYDVKKLFELITKTLTGTSQKLIEETRFNTKSIENLDESNNYVKSSESMNKSEVSQPSLIKLIAKHLVPKNNSQFRLLDDLDIDKWNDYKKKVDNTMVSYILETLV